MLVKQLIRETLELHFASNPLRRRIPDYSSPSRLTFVTTPAVVWIRQFVRIPGALPRDQQVIRTELF